MRTTKNSTETTELGGGYAPEQHEEAMRRLQAGESLPAVALATGIVLAEMEGR